MPDQVTGEMTQDEMKKVTDWLSEKGHKRAPLCPVTGVTKWAFAQYVVHTPRFSPNGQLIGAGFAYPMVMVSCPDCGYTWFVNAVQVGLYPPGSTAEPAPEAVSAPDGAPEAASGG